MLDTPISQGNFVLYKQRPARVLQAGERVEIELEDGKPVKVRPKDVVLLHPGPLERWSDLHPTASSIEGDLETAWELLAGGTTNLAELAELAFGDFTPATAWETWQHIADGLHFRGTPEEVEARTAEAVEQERQVRAAKAAEKEAWDAFIARVRVGQTGPQDERYLKELDDRAHGQRPDSRILRALGMADSPEKAHDLLLKLQRWDHTVNPYPLRLGVALSQPTSELAPLPDEPRRDLTHLLAFAIDDEGNQDPDDALSLDGNRLWVHVADVAALVPPDSEADLEARARGANLYLPESTITMLPSEATRQLGLGLSEVSPALSFGLDLSDEGHLLDIEVVPSWVRVTRITYAEVSQRLDEEPFKTMYDLAQLSEERRMQEEAISIELPEIKILVQDGQVLIEPLQPLPSRTLVSEAMVLAGEAVARFALERGLPFPFTTQSPPDTFERPTTLAEMFAVRKTLKRSQQTSIPAPHAGLGLEVYARATSPLRRYLDLVVHQQLRAFLRGENTLGEEEVMERVGAAEAVSGGARQVERLARRHWTLVYLLQHPNWRGTGVLVDKRGTRGTVLIPELSLEIQLPVPEDMLLDASIPLILTGVSLAELEAHFRLDA
jgi:exoribonuclease II